MVATSAFSGLVSSAWAFASAAAIAPIVSLDRCMIPLPHCEKVKADRAGFCAFGSDAMAERLFRILRHQRLQLGFGALVVEEGGAGRREQARKLRPGIGCFHIHDSDRL